MDTGDRRRQAGPIALGLSALSVLMAIAGIVVQYTVSESMGQTLIGFSVLGALYTLFRSRKRAG
jgi:uncharacterized membrane protein YfcA